MRVMRQGQVYSFGAYMQCDDMDDHTDAGNTASVIRSSVQSALSRVASVARCKAQFAAMPIGDDKCGWWITLTPSADTNTDQIGVALLEGANEHAQSLAPDDRWVGQNHLLWFGKYVVDEDSIVASDVDADPTVAGSWIARAVHTVATDENGASIAVQNAGKILPAAGSSAGWVTPVLIVSLGIAGLIALGYALRPVVDLVEEF